MKLRYLPRYIGEIRRRLVVTANLHAGNYKRVIWLVGDGRSGTTWLSELLNWDEAYRDMFEPFHPTFVRGMTHLPPYPYRNPEKEDPAFRELVEAVFTGRFRNGRVDAANRRLRYRGLLIKDVQANLFLAWAVRRFPHVRPIFLMRHPFATAVSKRNVKGGIWMEDPRDFLKREDLTADHLYPYRDLIESVSADFFERQVMIWAIVNLVPLRQLKLGEVQTVFYEHLLEEPEKVLAPLLAYTREELEPNALKAVMKSIDKPSKTVFNGSHVNANKNPLTAWRDQVTADQIKRGLEILKGFGLDHIYGQGPMPLSTDPFLSITS